ncbi:hypothetical protein ACJ72_01573 [Emergomyces africanus]|uniref:Uncharacterized protein n=1 Tax=Emergomyces africanus TaxID=1955775 RepID=A0A1B7P4Y4_9EURO|nr:hypothetical protein ACJ72_01573 [Emergomyces africanus]
MPSPPYPPPGNSSFVPIQTASSDPRKSKPDPPTFDPVHSLEGLASHVATIAALSSERERLRKRSQAESTALRKASDRNFQYPSIAKRLKIGKSELDGELVRVDAKLQFHQKMQNNLIKELAANFNSGQQQAQQTQLELEQMERNLCETKANMTHVMDSEDSISATLNLLNSSMQCNENKIAYIEQSRSSTEVELENLKSDLELIREEFKSAELSTKAHEKDFSTRLENVDHRVSELEKAFKELRETGNPGAASNTSVDAMNQIRNLRQVQDAKDEAIADELDKYELRLASLEELGTKFKQIGGHHSTNSQAFGISTSTNSELEQLRQALCRLNQHVDNRFRNIEDQSRILQAHQIALHSLETRYNHLSTEPIVQQMVVAMQEMYPHASIVQQEIPNIQEKTNKLASSLSSVYCEIRRAENARTALINDMTAERDRMTEEISSLRLKIDELEKALRSRLDEVENVVATNLASVILKHDRRPSSQNP